MCADSVKGLASELKRFLTSQEEDELIAAVAPESAAVAVSGAHPQAELPARTSSSAAPAKRKAPLSQPRPEPAHAPKRMQEGSSLTIEFVRAQTPPQNKEDITMTTAQKTKDLAAITDAIKACTRCPLGSTRINAVPGEGNVNAQVMFVGEGPGFDEDRQGRPFVGRAGQLLDKMIAAMGLTREEVFIANIAKCHPMTDPLHPEKHGNDRPPNAGEIACCRKYIEQQIGVICPKYVVALGGVAAKALISDANSLSALRGRFYNLKLDNVTLPKPVEILATFHPAALLRNPNWKKDAWLDLQMVMDRLGLKGARK